MRTRQWGEGMSRRFDDALNFLFSQEGGYVNDANDSGGTTKYGISQKQYPGVDIAHITRDRAARIYHREYWHASGCNEWPDAVALMTFDGAVNQGVSQSVMFLQGAVGVVTDGILGSKTRTAVNSGDPDRLLSEQTTLRMMHYAGLRQYPRYGHGWTRRIIACHALAVRWLKA